MIRYLLTIAALFLGLSANAQQPALGTPAEVRKFTDAVMSFVGSGNYDSAWKKLKPAAIIPPAEFDAFAAQFASQLPNIAPRYGKSTGFEYLRDQQIGTALLKFQYISKFEKSAMRWYFIFYRNQTGWVLSDFKFDGNLNALFPGEA